MRRLILAGLAVSVAACNAEPSPENASAGNDTVAAPASDAAPLPGSDTAGVPDTNSVDPDGNAAAPEPAPAIVIPAALRGRWALVPADCTSTRGDAKGLMTVSDTQLRFYESRATLTRVTERDDSRIAGDFSFIGEGQTWQRRMVLDGQDGGKTLIRREQGADAMPGALRYRKCEA